MSLLIELQSQQERSKQEMGYMFCEVCRHKVFESKWDTHITGDEHRRNISQKVRFWNREGMTLKPRGRKGVSLTKDRKDIF